MQTDKKAALQKEIFATDTPSRRLVVEYLKTAAREARRFPLDEFAVKPDLPTPRHFPANKAEEIASDITMIIQIDWVDDDPQLTEICNLSGGLEINTDDKVGWQELLDMIERLHD